MMLSVQVECDLVIFFFKQKTAYEMRISDWSSDVCSSDLRRQPSSAIPIFSLKFVKSLLTLCGKIPIYTNGLGQLAWGSLRWPGSRRGSSKVLTFLPDFLWSGTGARDQPAAARQGGPAQPWKSSPPSPGAPPPCRWSTPPPPLQRKTAGKG